MSAKRFLFSSRSSSVYYYEQRRIFSNQNSKPTRLERIPLVFMTNINQNSNYAPSKSQICSQSFGETESQSLTSRPRTINYKKISMKFNNSVIKPTTDSMPSNTLPLISKQNYSIIAETNSQQLNNQNSNLDVTAEKLKNQNLINKKKRGELSDCKERFNQIRFFYADPEIDKAADKPLIRLNPMAMMYMAVSDDDSHLLQSANYLRNELPIRLSHMIKELRNLPFIVAVNPCMLEVHERCIKTFRKFDNFDKEIKDLNTENKFIELVWEMLEMNKDLLVLLCDGFRDTRRYIKNESFIKTNLNRILSARLGLRLLCEHHVALSKQSNRKREDEYSNKYYGIDSSIYDNNEKNGENWIGIINKRFSPKHLIESSARLVSRICLDKYGVTPKLRIDGHTNAQFPYLPLPLEYILPELLKNSFRATCEQHRESSQLPDVNVTIAMNEKDFIFRIRDRGGGIPHHLTSKIFDYHFTTSGDESSQTNSDQVDSAAVMVNTSSTSSPSSASINHSGDQGLDTMGIICEASSTRGLAMMHGYGFGLPTSKAYAEYLGGSLTFQSMQGIGSDFYLRLALLDTEPEMVRI